MNHEGILNLAEFEAVARENVAGFAWDYYASGSDDEVTLRENRAAFERLALHYRVLVDVTKRSLATTVLGRSISMPVLVAPTAFHKLAHRDGEAATFRAASSSDTVMVLSTLSTTPIEEVRAAASGALWFQLYVYKDRGATKALVERVEAAGAEALVLTVDAPILGRRERDVRNRFQLPPDLRIENLHGSGLSALPAGLADSGLAAYFASMLDPSLSFRDLGWLASITKLPLVVKGVVRGDDARAAVDAGAAGIVVSNHGGRQLDGSPATIDVLEGVVKAVGPRAEVYVDGGVRRGTDVVKALSLGARAVLLGRPILWGLGAFGEPGVARVLALIREELDRALALAGCPDVRNVPRDLVSRIPR